jgi:hypothetical protein
MNKSQNRKDIIMDNGQGISFMEEANSFFKMDLTSKVHLKMETLMDKEDIFIIMDAFIKAK